MTDWAKLIEGLPPRDPKDAHTHLLMHPLHAEMIRSFPEYADAPLVDFMGYTVVISQACPIGAMFKFTPEEINDLLDPHEIEPPRD